MLTDTLYAAWQQLLEPYTDDQPLVEEGFKLITSRYTAPDRHYHTLQHIYALLQLQLEHTDAIADNENVLLAIFFHDVVYDVNKSDNEEQSALIATAFLKNTNYPAKDIEGVADFIRATKAHVNTNGNSDLDHFLDFDLSVLSAAPAAYKAYSQQIRAEYAVYPDEVYKPGRQKVLQHFLALPAIYKTDIFRAQHEAAARHNILEELSGLTSE